jgi:hypothetical protein
MVLFSVIYLGVINRLVLNRCLLGKANGLNLMAVGEISMMSGDNFIVLIIGFRSQKLMLGGSLEMMRGLAMVYSGSVMNFVVMFRCHV